MDLPRGSTNADDDDLILISETPAKPSDSVPPILPKPPLLSLTKSVDANFSQKLFRDLDRLSNIENARPSGHVQPAPINPPTSTAHSVPAPVKSAVVISKVPVPKPQVVPVPEKEKIYTEGQAALLEDDACVRLEYSMVKHRVGDIFCVQKQKQLIEDPTSLRPTARFLMDIGLSLIIHEYGDPSVVEKEKKDEEEAPAEGAESSAVVEKVKFDFDKELLPKVSHLILPFKYRCLSCNFRADTEKGVILHYQRGHLSADGVYRCAFDQFATREPSTFHIHLARMHKINGFPEPKPAKYPCTLCFWDGGTPVQYYKHFPQCLRKHAERGDRLLAEDSSFLSFCFQLDSLHHFGVQPLHGKLVEGKFQGKRIIMPEGSLKPAVQEPPVKTQVPPKPLLVKKPGPDVLQRRFVLCELCNGVVKNNVSLSLHLKAAHNVSVTSKQVEARLSAGSCVDCGKGFVTPLGLQGHRIWGSCPIGKACMFCQKPFDRANLFHHLGERHPQELKKLLAGGICVLCGGERRVYNLFHHMQAAHNISLSVNKDTVLVSDVSKSLGLMDCPKCSKAFLREELLRDHIIARQHFFDCFRCLAKQKKVRIVSREIFLAHLTNHHAGDKDVCQVCGQSFLKGFEFARHVLRAHTAACDVRLKRLRPEELPEPLEDPPAKRPCFPAAPPDVIEID